jgi:uncharacterized protein YbjT (DUF2867 family)
MYVIAGVSGHVGSVTAKELLGRKQKVRVLVRDAKKGEPFAKQGAEVAVGSLEDQAFLTKALQGATGAFLLVPPNFATNDFPAYQRKLADTMSAAVKASGVPHVVMLSSIGANLESGLGPISGLNYLERKLRETGTKLSALRAGFFQENVAMSIGPAKGQGIYPSFMPAEASMPMIATHDIGHEVVKALLQPPAKSQVVDLTGPSYTAAQAAALLGKRLGKELKVIEIPQPGWRDALIQGGMPPHFAELYVEMYAGFGQGLARPVGDKLVQGTIKLDETIAHLV